MANFSTVLQPEFYAICEKIVLYFKLCWPDVTNIILLSKKIKTVTLFSLLATLFSTSFKISVVQLIQAQENEEKNREISTGKQRLWTELNNSALLAAESWLLTLASFAPLWAALEKI